jgi:hypothetical protein
MEIKMQRKKIIFTFISIFSVVIIVYIFAWWHKNSIAISNNNLFNNKAQVLTMSDSNNNDKTNYSKDIHKFIHEKAHFETVRSSNDNSEKFISELEGPTAQMLDFKTDYILLINKQDELYISRRPYEEIAQRTKETLKVLFGDPTQKTIPSLLDFARKKLKEYWVSGDLSMPNAYISCYEAQAALELIITIDPDNPLFYDELAEIIGAAHPLEDAQVEKDKPRRTNNEIAEQLIKIREQQVQLYKKQNKPWPTFDENFSPVFKAFMELAYLQHLVGKYDEAATTMKEAATYSEKGGWGSLKSDLSTHAWTLSNTKSIVPIPADIAVSAMKRRMPHNNPKRLYGQDEAFRILSPWLRRGVFFEGPQFLEHLY